MAEITTGYSHDTLRIGGMDCPSCASEIENAVQRLPGVLACSVDFSRARLNAEFNRSQIDTERIQQEVRSLGFTASTIKQNDTTTSQNDYGILIIGAILWSLSWLPLPIELKALFALSAGLVAGYKMLRAGLLSLIRLRFTTNSLMTIAVIGAAALGEWQEAGAVTWLFALGNQLQSRTIRRTRIAVQQLTDSTPQQAQRISNGKIETVEVREIVPGDKVVVPPFSRIPIDGIVLNGSSLIDNSMITGESQMHLAEAGTTVLAGSLTQNGELILQAQKKFADTTFAKMIDLIEKGASSRTPQEETIEKFAKWYTPMVILIAIGFAITLPLLGIRTWSEALHQAFWLLMVSCPCALVIATPVATVAAIGAASRIGALVRGGVFLEAITTVRHWVFDKTGTLTYNLLELESIETYGESSKQTVITLASALAKKSAHPISKAIARLETDESPIVLDFQEEQGLGITGVIDGQQLRMGSSKYVGYNEPSENTTVYLADKTHVIAKFTLRTRIKQNAKAIINYLIDNGYDVHLFSGDETLATHKLAEATGIKHAQGKMSPSEKAKQVERLKEQGGVIVTGDGVNDVAALQRANVGVAMGAAGSDAAIESADIVLMNDDLSNLPKVINISKKLRAVITQNIIFSLSTKAILIMFGAAFVLPFWISVAGDMGVALLVIANAIRIR